MKNTKTCPKCKSKDIVIFSGSKRGSGTRGFCNSLFLGISAFSAVYINRYICCNCGYTEEWISKKDLEKVKNSCKVHSPKQ